MTSLRIAFMGTPDFAVPALQALIESDHEIVCVYTQPPRPKGRGQKQQISPVHECANNAGIEVRSPVSFKKDQQEAIAAFAALDLDVAIVAAYGLILPLSILNAPRYGCLNIHASLLPRWRGASPIQHAIWHGDDKSGVTIMQMEKGLDTGPMLLKQEIDIDGNMSAQKLHDELSDMGGAMILQTLSELGENNVLSGEKQDDALSNYAPMLHKKDGRVDWAQSAQEIDRQIRALNPWPGVWCMNAQQKRVKILVASLVKEGDKLSSENKQGTIFNRFGDVVCGDGSLLRLKIVQPENSRAMDFEAAFNGGHLNGGDIFS